MPLTMDPEIATAMAALMGPNPPPKHPVGDVDNRRIAVNAVFCALNDRAPPTPSVSRQTFTTKADDGHDLSLYWYTKSPTTSSPRPAVLYTHGGGMIALSIDVYDGLMRTYVDKTGVPFLFVEYRLAPEVRAPIPVTDAYAALFYLSSHASALNVDPARVALMGDSAGGGIAASLAHLCKARGGPNVCRQILIYPMLDDRNVVPDAHIAPFATWSYDDNATGWGALLGSEVAGKHDAKVPVTHAPGRMMVKEAEGLPPAYIDVGELDIFREEDLEYARVLGRAGVSVEFHLWRGAAHGFEAFAGESGVARRAMGERVRVLGEL